MGTTERSTKRTVRVVTGAVVGVVVLLLGAEYIRETHESTRIDADLTRLRQQRAAAHDAGAD